MKKNKIFKFVIQNILVATFILIATPVFAAEFSFENINNVSVGQQFKLDLNINTEKQSINAIEGKIIFSEDNLELLEVRAGNSIVNFWVDKPAYKDEGVIFSGIIPGGFMLDKGFVFSLIFKAKKEGDATVKIENASTLLNDGSGTKSKLKISNYQLKISPEVLKQGNEDIAVKDNELPDSFKPEVGREENLFDNKWFLVFAAQDKISGIDRYEVRESKYRIFDFSKWVESESPYVLEDQDLHSYIYVKAIDKSGNTRVIKLSPQNPLQWYANIENWFIIMLVIAVAKMYFFIVKKIKK